MLGFELAFLFPMQLLMILYVWFLPEYLSSTYAWAFATSAARTPRVLRELSYLDKAPGLCIQPGGVVTYWKGGSHRYNEYRFVAPGEAERYDKETADILIDADLRKTTIIRAGDTTE